MNIDRALDVVGGFRRWHVSMFAMIGASMFMHICWQGLIFVFAGWEPPHRCKLPPANLTYLGRQPRENETYFGRHVLDNQANSESLGNVTYLENLTSLSTTWFNVTTNKCFMILPNSTERQPCRYGWEYDNEGFYTLIEQWDLVCDRNYLAELSQTFYLVGYLVAVLLVSPLVDRFGRKPIFVYSQIFIGVIGLATAFVNSYPLFVALRALLGLVSLTNCNAGSTYLLELYDTKRRARAGIGVEFMWVACYMLLPVMAYTIKDWRTLQIVVSSAAFFWLIFIFILPESPQWLAAMGRKEDAEAVLNKMAQWNGVKLPEGGIKLTASNQTSNDETSIDGSSPGSKSVISVVTYDTDLPCSISNSQEHVKSNDGLDIEATEIKECNGVANGVRSRKINDENQSFERIPVFKLFTNCNLLCTLVICNFVWFANCFIYYGLVLATPTLAGNRFVNFALMGIVEIPATMLTFYTTDRCGRRLTTALYHVIAGLPLALVIFVPERTASGTDFTPLIIILVLISKFGISCSFAVIVVYLREIFPTGLRSTGGGMGQVFGCLGNMVAPMCAYASKTSLYWLPNILYGMAGVIVGLLTLVLPETAGRPMPQSLADLEEMYSNRRFTVCCHRSTAKIDCSNGIEHKQNQKSTGNTGF